MAQLNITLNQEEILQHISDLQVFVRDRTRHIYDERRGEVEKTAESHGSRYSSRTLAVYIRGVRAYDALRKVRDSRTAEAAAARDNLQKEFHRLKTKRGKFVKRTSLSLN